MLINDILKGYLGLFKLILKVFILVLSCLIFGFIIVYPLWKLSTSYPSLYSKIIIGIALISFIILIILSIRKKLMNESEDEKKALIFNYKRKLFLTLLLVLILILSVFLLSIGKIIIGFIVLFFGLILYGVVFFAYKKK